MKSVFRVGVNLFGNGFLRCYILAMESIEFLRFNGGASRLQVVTMGEGNEGQESLGSMRRRAGFCIDDIARRMGKGRDLVEQIEAGFHNSNSVLVRSYLDALAEKRGLSV